MKNYICIKPLRLECYDDDGFVVENKYFDNGAEALNYYTHLGSQFSEIIDAEDMYELQCKMGEMMLNYRNEEWLNKNVYPRI